MKLRIAAVGKLREPAVRAIADDYLGRIRRYARCDEVEVKEGVDLARAVPAGFRVVALEVDGAAMNSVAFARALDGWSAEGKGEIAFLIGGAEGIPAEVSRAAQHRLSLSALTLPHRLVRVLLYEQLYRAMTISRGEPYAREG